VPSLLAQLTAGKLLLRDSEEGCSQQSLAQRLMQYQVESSCIVPPDIDRFFPFTLPKPTFETFVTLPNPTAT
jgi:hypothetical protein